MEAYTSLRCKSCGAGLNVSDPNAQFFVCNSCGNTTVRSDAVEATEQAKIEIMSWLRKALPTGINFAQTENIDPLARHNIFITSIRPNIDSEFREYRFGFINILSNQLIAMPSRRISTINIKHDTKALFNFDAKIKSVESMAIDDEGKKLLSQSSKLTQSYAVLINIAKLLKEDPNGRYHFMANNFKLAAESMEGVSEFDIVKKRFEALSIISDGIADVIEDNCLKAVSKIKNGLSILAEAKSKASASLDFGSMANAISKEEVVGKTVLSMAEAINKSPELDSGTALVASGNVVKELDREEKISSGEWNVLMKRPERYTDIFSEFSKVLGSKAGANTIKLVKGKGNFLVPFWVLEIKYSFITGGLKKRSVEVSETVLLSAAFTTGDDTMMNPRAGLTDIFSSRPETKFLDSFKGNETSISMGGGIKNLLSTATEGYGDSSKIVVPVSTRQEAELKCNGYLQSCQSSYSKLKMGKSVAKELVFLPCNATGSSLALAVDLGSMAPKNLGNTETMQKISI